MQFIYHDSREYGAVEEVRNSIIIEGARFPMNIFKDQWTFLSPQYAEVSGQKEGIFHKKVAAFLKSKKQEHYYIFPLDWDTFTVGRIEGTFHLPAAKLSITDTPETYEMAWATDHATGTNVSGHSYLYLPQLFLFANEHKDWIIFEMIDPAITFLGYKERADGEKLLNSFDNYKYLNANELENEIRHFYKEAKENFIANYLSALRLPDSL